jgi:glutathione reductase (NADPH)
MKQYDLIVIGTGESGKTVARKLKEEGFKTAIVDRIEYGGTCALRGCDPKKVLRAPAEALALSRQLMGKGILSCPEYSWQDLMRFKRTFTDKVPEKTVEKLQEEGIDTYFGEAKFISEDTLQVKDDQLQGKHIVLATGADPMPLGIPGEELMIDSTQFMELHELPDEILFVGGGYIAFEFAHIAARFGVKVTILHRSEMPLEKFEPDIVEYLLEGMKELSIDIKVNTKVTAVEKEGERFKIKAEHKKDGQTEEVTYHSKLVIHSAGRVPALDALELEKGKVERTKKGVKVNEYLQSVSNPKVYACGDASDHGLPLTPVAVKEAYVVAENIRNNNQMKADFPAIPTICFSIPPIASVGLTEKQAKEKGINYELKQNNAKEWFTAHRINERAYGFKVLIDKDKQCVVGAHLVGPHAEELINMFALALNSCLITDKIKHMIFAYPTSASDIVYML